MLGPSDTVEQRESVSIVMLTLMERLSAKEGGPVVFAQQTTFWSLTCGDVDPVLGRVLVWG
jgi:hypothetical protein